MTACRTTQSAVLPYIDLSERVSLSARARTGERPLRVAVGAILSPQGTVDSYREFAAYMSVELERPVEIVQRRTYEEINELIAQGTVDLAFICTGAYLAGTVEDSLSLLVAPEIGGQSTYYSTLIVPAESSAQTMADLRGKDFVFTDPMSLTGRVYPTYLVQLLGRQPIEFFANVSYTYSHDSAIKAVADGIVDGTAVDNLVLRYAIKRDHSLKDKVRVIHTSQPFGIPPVVVPQNSPTVQAVRLQQILLEMDATPAGRTVLSHLGVDRFVQIKESAYTSARSLIAETSNIP